jgi:hypothetical protein
MAEVQQQRLHELLVQQMTRAVPVAIRISIQAINGFLPHDMS